MGVPRSRVKGWGLVALGVVGCSLPRPEDVGQNVSGSVDGMWEGATIGLDLVSSGGSSMVTVAGNGAFAFPKDVAPGATFEVRVHPPAGHTCTVENGIGVVSAADVTNVGVHCQGPAVQLTFDVPARGTFDPAQVGQRFDTTVLSWAAAVRVEHEALTDVVVGATHVSPGAWSAPVPLTVGTQTLAVTAYAGAASRIYQLEIGRGTVPIAQTLYVKSSNGRTGDTFGAGIALGRDRMIVGAPGHDDARTNSGAVYAFAWQADGTRETGYLRTNDEHDNDAVGPVAMSGDRFVVGVAARSLAVVFHWNGTIWQEEATLTPTGGETTDSFGGAVAIDGNRVVIGAPHEDSNARTVGGDPSNNGALDAGAAYVFDLQGATWTQVAYLKATNADAGDLFGSSVAVRGDVVAVGAPYEASASISGAELPTDNTRPGAGAVYVFAPGPWAQAAYLKGATLDTWRLGASLALGDGVLVSGAPQAVANGGAVFAYDRMGAGWSPARLIIGSDTDDEDAFGTSVAVDGDLVVVGAYGEAGLVPGVDPPTRTEVGSYPGATYVFHRAGDTYVQNHYVKPLVLDNDDYFGWAVGVARGRMCASALQEASASRGLAGDPNDDSAPLSGAVYCFE